MTGKKDGEEKEKKIELDLESFELQIDSEIDSRFVPGSRVNGGEGQSSGVALAGDKEMEVARVAVPLPTLDPPTDDIRPARSKLDIDIDAFEMQIDQEIDSLFIPLGYAAEPEEQPSRVEMRDAATLEVMNDEASTIAIETVDTEEQPEPQIELEGVIESRTIEMPKDEAPFQPVAAFQVDVAPREPLQIAEQQELASLIEAFNITYLSLDWEFSVENASKCKAALEKLEPYCKEIREAHFLFRILKTLLHRLKMQPNTVQPQLVELVRDAQELIKPFLLTKDALPPSEKEKLRNLIARFQEMRERVLAKKGKRIEQPLYEQYATEAISAESRPRQTSIEQVPLPLSGQGDLSAELQSGMAASVPTPAVLPTPTTLSEFCEWMELYRTEDNQALQGLEEDGRRLTQIEQVLAKAPALAGIAARVGKIRSNLQGYVHSCNEKQAGWMGRVDWLRNFEEGLQVEDGGSLAEPPFDSVVVEEPPLDDSIASRKDISAPATETRKDHVFLFSLAGKRMAVLASQVVKIEPLSAKKAQKILSRGYATLLDFKPFFRSIKTGLFGAWAALPEGILKTYRFVPLSSELFNLTSESSSIGGVVLVSSGKKHGVILTESAEADLHSETEIVVSGSGEEKILGTIKSDSEKGIEVFNLDQIMNNLD